MTSHPGSACPCHPLLVLVLQVMMSGIDDCRRCFLMDWKTRRKTDRLNPYEVRTWLVLCTYIPGRAAAESQQEAGTTVTQYWNEMGADSISQQMAKKGMLWRVTGRPWHGSGRVLARGMWLNQDDI